MITIALMLLISNAMAGTDNICQDLAKFACAPGTYNDGTGIATRPPQFPRLPLMIKLTDVASAEYKKEFKKPDNTYFREIVLSATGLSSAPQCKNAEKKPTEQCLEDMIQGASEITMRYFENPPPEPDLYNYEQGSLADIHYFVSSDQYLNIRNKIIASAIANPSKDESIKKINTQTFPQIKSLLIAKISDLVKDVEIRKRLIDKVKAIRFKGVDCPVYNTTDNPISAILAPNAYYEPFNNSFQYCESILTNSSSDFAFAFVIAHEVSHSIDPCGISMGPNDFTFEYPSNLTWTQAEQAFPVGNVLQCLRRSDSIGAVNLLAIDGASYQDRPPNFGSEPTSIAPEMDGSLPSSSTFKSFCSNSDQIGESFADWMATELTTSYISRSYPKLTSEQLRLGYSNALRFGCNGEDEMLGEASIFNTHPSTNKRINSILLTHPTVRRQMGCPGNSTKYIYCPAEGLPEDLGLKSNETISIRHPVRIQRPSKPMESTEKSGVRE
ncbi:MAG: hypothetical protein KDD22_04435 [Bdellovibrionales bacterium]|nr:hypothetical protein [Bdellovibrionales bacterium]